MTWCGAIDFRLWLAAIILTCVLPVRIALCQATAISATQPASVAPPALPWHISLADALEDARKRHVPVLADVGASWCEWCRRLDDEIAKPQAQEKLAGWARVRIDADHDPETVRLLAVGPIPALRILTPTGRIVAARNGFLNVQDLLAWLNAHYDQAVAVPAKELAESGPPAPAAIDALVKELANPDAVAREAATRRLIRAPAAAAPKVAALFASGNLRQRLTALELLRAWRAPLDDADPWNARTITPEKIAALKTWAESPNVASATQPAALTTAQLDAARRDIAAMLHAGSDAELQANRERLARLGPALLPEVQAQLSAAPTDKDRQRLAALRYRLAASDALALNWPDGFDRLASVDPQVRRSSLDELATRLTPDDEPLLTELFASPDPFVRERSLQFMQAAGSDTARAGLLKLLNDPEANVRAAVLKQLAETPDAAMVPDVVKYVAGESDTDLVVHAVRFFREVKTGPAIQALLSLLSNPSWRVRAEAAVALGKCLENNRGSQYQDAVYAAMDKLLEDPDGFVAGQAVIVLKSGPIADHVAALVKATEKRPELAQEVVKVLANDTQSPKAQKQLHQFTASADPQVHQAALAALGENASGDEIVAALASRSAALRQAGAKSVMAALEATRPDHKRRFDPNGPAKIDWPQWLADFRAGKGRPQWTPQVLDPLKKMLDSDQAAERLPAAIALVALSDDPRPIAILKDAARADRSLARDATQALPWMPFEPRLEMFNALRPALAGDAGSVGGLAVGLGATPDPRAAPALWDLLADSGADVTLAEAVLASLGNIYFGESPEFSNGAPRTPASAKQMIPQAKSFAASGAANQRLVALALLLRASRDDAVEAARPLVENPQTGQGLRVAAFQVLLCGLDKKDAAKEAIDRLASNDASLRRIALTYLAVGKDRLRVIQDRLYLQTFGSDDMEMIIPGKPIIISAPAGLKPEPLAPLLKDADPENQAFAGYLLCLINHPEGLEPLMSQWRRQTSDSQWRRLLFRAVATLADDARTPLLADVYRSYGKDRDWELPEFYWTIRTMDGPNILKLRKQIRDEVGMQKLQ